MKESQCSSNVLGTASFAVESFLCPCVVSCPFPLRRKSSLEEVFQGLAVFVVDVLRMHASRSGRNAIRSFEVGINFGEDF